MHVDRQRISRRMVSEPALLLANLGKGKAQATEFLRYCLDQVARRLHDIKIFLEEFVILIVFRDPGLKRLELFG
jgi:hypothetical protein